MRTAKYSLVIPAALACLAETAAMAAPGQASRPAAPVAPLAVPPAPTLAVRDLAATPPQQGSPPTSDSAQLPSRPAGAPGDGDLTATCRSLYETARLATDPDESARLFREGEQIARAGRGRDPADPAALLWWVAHAGQLALLSGKLSALFVVPELESALLDLRRLAPQYEHAAADRGLARLYQKAPPFISVGSRSKAREHYEAALAADPDFAGNLILYADFLADQGEDERAMALLRQALAQDRDAWPLADRAEWQAIALDLAPAG